MASHAQLAITKASLLAALLKPTPDADLPACSRTDIEALHRLLSTAAARCSPANVQKCKLWMLQHLVRSSSRAAAFGKYLVAFANSQSSDAKAGAASKPSAKRTRLHLLHILNDLLFHVKHRTPDQVLFAAIEPHLTALFKSAAAFPDAPKHTKKLQDLIRLWQQEGYFPDGLLDQLREAVAKGPSAAVSDANGGTIAQPGNSAASSAFSRDAPYLLPSMHGDPSTPWYDLPAANWLPVIEPNSTRPMNPSMIKPLQLASGPAEKSLVQAVKKLMGDVDKIYGAETQLNGDASVVDISQMGEVIERDGLGEIVGGETYYGWSRAFCKKMRARKNGDAMDIDDDDRQGRWDSSRSNSRSRSRSSSRPAMKRRRISNSRSRSRTRSYSRRRSRSYSSRSRSPSRSPRRRNQTDRDSSPRSRSYSPPQVLGASSSNNNPPPPVGPAPPHNTFVPPIPQQRQQQHFFNQPPPPPPAPHHFPSAPLNFAGGTNYMHPPPPQHHMPPQPPPLAVQQGYNAWNAPPPPPPFQHYQGHWPPAPPPAGLPQPMAQGWYPPSTGAVPPPLPLPPHGGWAGGWGPLAPPPPPPAGAPQQGGGYGYGGNTNANNRGGNSGGYRGRGGYGNGSGRGW